MKISILIPCHNEEESIHACIQSCLNQTRKADQILVVNDGSTDKSPQILKKFGKKVQVIDIYPATGNKSYAQEVGIQKVKGDIFIQTDGDTILDKNFIQEIASSLSDPDVHAVGGYVQSSPYNYLTAYRAFDYIIGQDIHKRAQDLLGYLFVIPGAASAFKTKFFIDNVRFDHDTLTEDLDFTYKLHKSGKRIAYNRKAITYTQDPPTVKSYINQMRRWYAGGWQNLKKHLSLPLLEHPGRSLELSLMYVEGIVYASLMYLLPILSITRALQMYALLEIATIFQVLYAYSKSKRKDLIVVPFMAIPVMYVNSYIYLEQFIKEVIFQKKNLTWFHPERVKI